VKKAGKSFIHDVTNVISINIISSLPRKNIVFVLFCLSKASPTMFHLINLTAFSVNIVRNCKSNYFTVKNLRKGGGYKIAHINIYTTCGSRRNGGCKISPISNFVQYLNAISYRLMCIYIFILNKDPSS
jgi:hypothetical protein